MASTAASVAEVLVADQLYLMQLDFEKRAQERRAAVDRNFQRLRDEEQRRQEERNAREGQTDEAAPLCATRATPVKELQIIYEDED
ncbi:MAG: hypothetical protein QOG19_2218 [Mycobacterium sp.]|jgi:23S rRNA-/tRNA-specific pseudouridylate synthase|nr:hypothetical protein [Mycobacterium sp.]